MSSFPPPPKSPEPYGQSSGQPYGGGPGSEPPLYEPFYGISFGGALRRFFAKYATFSGRASRSEFWWTYLAIIIVAIVLQGIGSAAGGVVHTIFTVVYYIFFLGILVPTLAVTWRRLHDTDRSGGWYFIGFVPLVGGILLIVWLASSPKPEGQRFDTPGVQYDPPAPQY